MLYSRNKHTTSVALASASEASDIAQQLNGLERDFEQIENLLQSEEAALAQCKVIPARCIDFPWVDNLGVRIRHRHLHETEEFVLQPHNIVMHHP